MVMRKRFPIVEMRGEPTNWIAKPDTPKRIGEGAGVVGLWPVTRHDVWQPSVQLSEAPDPMASTRPVLEEDVVRSVNTIQNFAK